MSDRESSGSACALIAFEGTRVDKRIAELVADPRVAGVTLYGSINIEDAEQTRRLTDDLQSAAGRPLLIAVDQEGGQLNAAGPDTTPFAGNMALGAVGDVDLAWEADRVARGKSYPGLPQNAARRRISRRQEARCGLLSVARARIA